MKTNWGFVACGVLSAVAAAFLVAAISTPELSRVAATLTSNATGAAVAGTVRLGYFRVCRSGFGGDLADDCAYCAWARGPPVVSPYPRARARRGPGP
jgi:hypothetical protein